MNCSQSFHSQHSVVTIYFTVGAVAVIQETERCVRQVSPVVIPLEHIPLAWTTGAVWHHLTVYILPITPSDRFDSEHTRTVNLRLSEFNVQLKPHLVAELDFVAFLGVDFRDRDDVLTGRQHDQRPIKLAFNGICLGVISD